MSFFGKGSLLDVLIGGKADVLDLFGRQADQDIDEQQKIQEAAEKSAIGEQRRQFDIQQENLRPFRELTLPALGKVAALSGAQGQEAQQAGIDQFIQSPGQKFLQDRAQKNLLRNSSAIGGLGGGNVRSALVQQGVGFAQQDFENQFNRLASVAGISRSATTELGQAGQQFGRDVGASETALANIRTSGIQARNQNRANTANTGLGIAAAFFSDERLKENIRLIGEHSSGLNLYSWDWNEEATDLVGDQNRFGVIAQEALEMFPNAVTMDGEFMKVNYAELH